MEKHAKEHPILFSGPLVRAILDGRKTQTRRLLRAPHGIGWVPAGPVVRTAADLADPWFRWERKQSFAESEFRDVRCPYGRPGDRLWVRETWSPSSAFDNVARRNKYTVFYKADGAQIGGFEPPEAWKEPVSVSGRQYGEDLIWVPSIHMPRWASRIDLEVTEVRAQRIQDITEEDARAEGVHEHPLGRAALDARGTHKGAFLAVWEAINGARPGGSIAANPWVWAVTFKRLNGGGNV